MKSVSPSAVIIGPMTGIFMEALFIDLVLRAGRGNFSIILLAGAASQLSALIHKVASMLIRYGWDIVRIYENIFEFAVGQLSGLEIPPSDVLLFLILLYIFAGMLAAFLGYRLGRPPAREPAKTLAVPTVTSRNNQWDIVDPSQFFSIKLLLAHLVILPLLMFLLDYKALHPLTLVCYGGYLTLNLVLYKRIKFRLFKPFFWLHMIIIAVMAGLFWQPQDGEPALQAEGWITGLLLNLRAILVITGFSALSTELRNPKLRNLLFRFGFRKAYNAVSMAFSILPLMMERGAKGWAFLSRPIRGIRGLLSSANDWYYVLQQDQQNMASSSHLK